MVCKEVLDRGQQKRPESAPPRIHDVQEILFNHQREEFLSQVLSLIPIVTTPPDECEDRTPVGFAQFFEGRA